jgi:hypothetical protein
MVVSESQTGGRLVSGPTAPTRDHEVLLQPVRYEQGQLGSVTGPALTLQGSERDYDHIRVALSRCQLRPYSGSAVLSPFELGSTSTSTSTLLAIFPPRCVGLCPYSGRRHGYAVSTPLRPTTTTT